MLDVTEYNQWRKNNPQKSIIDFCHDNQRECDLDIITEIMTLSKIVELGSFTADIEVNIKNEIARVFSEVINNNSDLENHFRESIEDNLAWQLDFEFDDFEFEYNFAYDLGIEINDQQFNEYINFKLTSVNNFDNFLPSQKNRLRLMYVTEQAPMFLYSLAKSIPNGVSAPISFNYEGFEFHYDNMDELPSVVFDDQIQEYLEEKYNDITNLVEMDFVNQLKQHFSNQIKNDFERVFYSKIPSNGSKYIDQQGAEYLRTYEEQFKKYIQANANKIHSTALYDEKLQEKVANDLNEFDNSITSTNIYMHINAFIDLNKLFDAYEEACFMKSGELMENFNNTMESTYRKIIDTIVDNFNYSIVGDLIPRDQLDDMLDLCAIDDYLSNLHLTIDEAQSDFNNPKTDEATVLGHIINSYDEAVQDLPIREKISEGNENYRVIQNNIRNDQSYNLAKERLAIALANNDLLDQHRIIAAITRTIRNKYIKLSKENNTNVDDSLASALEETEHYHKTFVLGNNIGLLKYPSKHPEKVIKEDISQIFERLQFTGRHLNRMQQVTKLDIAMESSEGDITWWQQEISNANNKIKQILADSTRSQKKIENEKNKLLQNNENKELQCMRATEKVAKLKKEINLLNETSIPKRGDNNILVPTFMFTVGYKDKDRNTIKREFIEVPISSDLLQLISSENFEENKIKSLVKKTDDNFRSNIRGGKEIDTRDLETKHSFDSERIFNAFLAEASNIKSILNNLTENLYKRDNNWNKDGRTCKIYAATILAYSTNATCRNCTRVYINLSNDRSQGSFLNILTTQINKIPGLFAYPSGEQKEGIRLRSLVIADYDYHEHQGFVKSHPETIIHKGKSFDIKRSDKKSFVEMVQQKVGVNQELHKGASFRSGI